MNFTVHVRRATKADATSMHRIRLAVRENELSDPVRISERSYLPYLEAGSGWVAETEAGVVGFAILDAAEENIWALFVDPQFEGMGIGRALHECMLQWAREHGLRCLSLTTGPGTRAERFYREHGWTEMGLTADGEVRFERSV